MKPLLLLDGHGMLHRAYHAFPAQQNTNGHHTGAVTGCFQLLFSLIQKFEPDRFICVFDHPGGSFRHHEHDFYKAQRPSSPDDFRDQIPLVKELVTHLWIPVVCTAGFEADDVLGAYSRTESLASIIVSADMDMLQLVSPNCFVARPKTWFREFDIYDTQKVVETYGFAPELIPDYKGLSGDQSDNLSGVPGIGPKRAREFLERYGSLDELYEHLSELPLRMADLLQTHKDTAFLCRSLATIHVGVPVDTSLIDAYNPRADQDFIDWTQQHELFFLQKRWMSYIDHTKRMTDHQESLFS